MTPDPDLPRVRALALGAVALAVTAAGAIGGDARTPGLVAAALAFGAVGTWRWQRAGRTGVSTSALVAAVLTALLLLEQVTDSVDVALGITAAVTLAASVGLRERRLAVSGLLALGALLGRPVAGGATFQHCLVATDVVVPVPRIDGPLVLAAAAVAVGTALRWTGWAARLRRSTVGRGIEATGAVAVTALLLAKAAELPDHRLLCGSGDGIDPGWVVVGIAVGVVAGLYGLAARDLVWEAVGLASIAGQGLLATTLAGTPWWAAGCGVLLVGALVVAEWVGVPWPDQPGYDVARPGPADLRVRATARRAAATDDEQAAR